MRGSGDLCPTCRHCHNRNDPTHPRCRRVGCGCKERLKMVKCRGEAHKMEWAYDHCMVCLPLWGEHVALDLGGADETR